VSTAPSLLERFSLAKNFEDNGPSFAREQQTHTQVPEETSTREDEVSSFRDAQQEPSVMVQGQNASKETQRQAEDEAYYNDSNEAVAEQTTPAMHQETIVDSSEIEDDDGDQMQSTPYNMDTEDTTVKEQQPLEPQTHDNLIDETPVAQTTEEEAVDDTYNESETLPSSTNQPEPRAPVSESSSSETTTFVDTSTPAVDPRSNALPPRQPATSTSRWASIVGTSNEPPAQRVRVVQKAKPKQQSQPQGKPQQGNRDGRYGGRGNNRGRPKSPNTRRNARPARRRDPQPKPQPDKDGFTEVVGRRRATNHTSRDWIKKTLSETVVYNQQNPEHPKAVWITTKPFQGRPQQQPRLVVPREWGRRDHQTGSLTKRDHQLQVTNERPNQVQTINIRFVSELRHERWTLPQSVQPQPEFDNAQFQKTQNAPSWDAEYNNQQQPSW